MGADDNRPWSALAVHHPGFPLLTAKTLNAIGRLAPGTAAKNSALAEALTQAGIDKDSIGVAIGDLLARRVVAQKGRQDARSGLYWRRAGHFRPRRVPVLRRASREKRRLSLYSRGANGVGLQTPPGRQIDCGTPGGARIGAAKAYRDYSGNRAFGRLLSVGSLARVRFRVALMYWTKPARVLDFHDGW